MNTQETKSLPETSFMRLPAVLAVVPVSKSTLWAWIAAGRFPAPTKLGPRVSAWSRASVSEFLAARAAATEESKA